MLFRSPKDLAGLADAFHSSDEAIRRFSFTQTERGVSSFLAVALANGVKAPEKRGRRRGAGTDEARKKVVGCEVAM